MTREQIINLAREQGLPETEVEGVFIVNSDDLGRLLAAEREHCAKLVEPTDEHRRDASWGYLGGEEGVELLDEIAAAIRSRSQA